MINNYNHLYSMVLQNDILGIYIISFCGGEKQHNTKVIKY